MNTVIRLINNYEIEPKCELFQLNIFVSIVFLHVMQEDMIKI